MAKTQNLAIKQLLANTETVIGERVTTILDNQGTLTDVEDYCLLLEHSLKTIRHKLAQDQQILNLGDDTERGNFAATNEDYNACVAAMFICLELTPNPMYRDDLRLHYYKDLLEPSENVDYKIMRVSLENMVIKLNKGKPYVKPTDQPKQEVPAWKRVFLNFSLS